MLSGSLPDTAAAALHGGADALAAFRLQVGRPIRPMLASPAESLAEALDELGGEVTVEYKLDGARIQVHRDGDEGQRLHQDPAGDHRERARAGRAGPRAALRAASCSTGKPSR